MGGETPRKGGGAQTDHEHRVSLPNALFTGIGGPPAPEMRRATGRGAWPLSLGSRGSKGLPSLLTTGRVYPGSPTKRRLWSQGGWTGCQEGLAPLERSGGPRPACEGEEHSPKGGGARGTPTPAASGATRSPGSSSVAGQSTYALIWLDTGTTMPLSQPALDCTRVQGRSPHTHRGLWLGSDTDSSWSRVSVSGSQYRKGNTCSPSQSSWAVPCWVTSRPVIAFTSTWGNTQNQHGV